MRRLNDLPPLMSLRAFEAAGRLLNFSRAGAELFISQSAVSHHVRQLEASLKTALFVREARGVQLTAAGADLLAHVQLAFREILTGTALAKMGNSRRATVLRLSVVPAFAHNWLIPRLGDWRHRHPDVELIIDPTLRVVDIEGGEADIAVRYGDGRWPEVGKRMIMREQLTPIVSRKLYPSRSRRAANNSLLELPRLMNSSPMDWQLWLRESKSPAQPAPEVNLTDYNLVLRAAVDGQGIAMGRLSLIETYLKDGSLVTPFKCIAKPKSYGYWLVYSSKRPIAGLGPFQKWIESHVLAPAG